MRLAVCGHDRKQQPWFFFLVDGEMVTVIEFKDHLSLEDCHSSIFPLSYSLSLSTSSSFHLSLINLTLPKMKREKDHETISGPETIEEKYDLDRCHKTRIIATSLVPFSSAFCRYDPTAQFLGTYFHPNFDSESKPRTEKGIKNRRKRGRRNHS